MRPSAAYSLLRYLPDKVRDYGANTLDKAFEQLESFLTEHKEIDISADEKERIMLAVFLNFLEGVFVKSFENYTTSFSYLGEHEINSMQFGSRSYDFNGYLTKNWKAFIEAYETLRLNLWQYNIPSGQTIPRLVEELRRGNEQYRE